MPRDRFFYMLRDARKCERLHPDWRVKDIVAWLKLQYNIPLLDKKRSLILNLEVSVFGTDEEIDKNIAALENKAQRFLEEARN